ncbi:Pilin (type 1 fimbria component protein) [Enterobacter sp. CC120223-11]|nr:Pilin (type 1 fimbria component protein) [Enterobacter sp. CC120223-11]
MGQIIKAAGLVFSFMLASGAFSATQQGQGRVSMQGAIIDTACAISVDSREQVIDMGRVPIADIIRDGQGIRRDFSIKLVNCVLERPYSNKPDWKQFQVTFDGDAEGDLFGVRGDASGVALRILDKVGNVAMPGKALPLENIIPGDLQLDYTLRLVANNHALRSGDYFSTIRFKLDYF